MHTDEITANHVPVRVFEGELEVVECVNPHLKRLGDLVPVLERESRNGVVRLTASHSKLP